METLLICLLQVVWMFCSPSELKFNGRCVKNCPQDKYIFDQSCIDECPPDTRRLETALANHCKSGLDISCQRIHCEFDYPYCYKENCLSTCPAFTVSYNNSIGPIMCLDKCPDEAPFLTAYECEGICFDGTKECSESCPDTHPFSFDSLHFRHCLKMCPEYIISSTKSKKCIVECPVSFPYFDNNTCVDSCPPTKPIIAVRSNSNFSQIRVCSGHCAHNEVFDNNYCVSFCPSGKYLFNNTCVRKCPETNPNLFSKHLMPVHMDINNFGRADYMCVDNCYSYLLYGNVCLSSCPKSAQFEYNGTCLVKCPTDYSYSVQTSRSKKCVEMCDTFYYNSSCMKFCPVDAPFIFNKTCIRKCPLHHQFWDNVKNTCVSNCSNFYYRGKCVSVCPNNALYIFNSSCMSNCSERQLLRYDKIDMNSYYLRYEHTCVKSCPVGTFHYKNDSCVYNCPKEAKYRLGEVCVNRCGQSLYEYSNTTNIHTSRWTQYVLTYFCLHSCPYNTLIVNTINTTKCLASCTSEKNYELNGTCIEKCPKGHQFKLRKESYFKCLIKCPISKRLDFNRTCVNVCPKRAEYQSNGHCLERCNVKHPLTYTNITSMKWGVSRNFLCLNECPEKTFRLNSSCVESCPISTFAFNSTCVYGCPTIYPMKYAIITKLGYWEFTCVNKCPNNTFYSNDTCYNKCPKEKPFIARRTCVKQCDKNIFFEQSINGKICRKRCPKNFYVDEKQCVKECPQRKVIADMRCEDKCPDAFPISYKEDFFINSRITCYQQCPSGYVANGTVCILKRKCGGVIDNHICYEKCPFITIQNGIFGNDCEARSVYFIIAILCIIGFVSSGIFLYFCVLAGLSPTKQCRLHQYERIRLEKETEDQQQNEQQSMNLAERTTDNISTFGEDSPGIVVNELV